MEHIKRFLYKYHYDILIFAFLLLQLRLMMPGSEDLHDWTVTSYALNYSHGFASRLLIGSIVSLCSAHPTAAFVHLFIFISLVIMCAAIALFLGSCIRATQSYRFSMQAENARTAAISLCMLYLASPASPAHLFLKVNYGRMDVYLILFTLLALVCIRRKSTAYLAVLLCVLAVAAHQVYVFTYFLLMLGALLWHTYENRYDKRSICFAAVLVSLTAAAFIYFQFFGHLDSKQVDLFMLKIRYDSGIPLSRSMIEFEYFRGIADHVQWFASQDRLVRGIVAFILMSPLTSAIIYIFGYAIRHSDDRALRFSLWTCALLPLISIPAYALTVDWGRWLACAYTVQVFLILYLAKEKCRPIILALSRLTVFVNEYPAVFLTLLLYFTLLDKFRDDGFHDVTNRIVDSLLPNLSTTPLKLLQSLLGFIT